MTIPQNYDMTILWGEGGEFRLKGDGKRSKLPDYHNRKAEIIPYINRLDNDKH